MVAEILIIPMPMAPLSYKEMDHKVQNYWIIILVCKVPMSKAKVSQKLPVFSIT